MILFFSLPMVFSAGRFTDNGNGMLTDHELGLFRAKMDNLLDVNWQGADWYCNMGPPDIVGKYKGCRMPTVEELRSLLSVKKFCFGGWLARRREKVNPVIRYNFFAFTPVSYEPKKHYL